MKVCFLLIIKMVSTCEVDERRENTQENVTYKNVGKTEMGGEKWEEIKK